MLAVLFMVLDDVGGNTKWDCDKGGMLKNCISMFDVMVVADLSQNPNNANAWWNRKIFFIECRSFFVSFPIRLFSPNSI